MGQNSIAFSKGSTVKQSQVFMTKYNKTGNMIKYQSRISTGAK